MANASDGSTSSLDSTFVLETRVPKQVVRRSCNQKTENEYLKMLDFNNNSPTMRVLQTTTKKNIFPPGIPGSQGTQETKGSAVANEKYSFQLGDPVWAKMKVNY